MAALAEPTSTRPPTPAAASMLARFGTPELLSRLGTRRTAGGWSLSDLTRSGRRLPESSVGLYAGDAESYDVFIGLLDPVLSELAGPARAVSPGLGHGAAIVPFASPAVRSVRVRVARNVATYRFPPAMDRAERLGLEELVRRALCELGGDLEGRYDRLEDLTPERSAWLAQRHLLFDADDRFMREAGILDDWPTARGVFANATGDFAVWVNEEDHLRLMSVEPGGDLPAVADRLRRGLFDLEKRLPFARHARHGFLSACPSNAGFGMRASVHVARGDRDEPTVRALAARFGLSVRGAGGENSSTGESLVDLSLKHRVSLGFDAHLLALQHAVNAWISAPTAG